MAAFDVSAITVRRAIRELISEGVLVGRQGLGVFVTDRRRIIRSLNGEFKASLGEAMRHSGRQPGIKPISLRMEPCGAAAARRLHLAPGTQVYRHEKLVLADGETVSRSIIHLPRAVGERLVDELSEEFLLPLLRAHDIAIDRFEYAIEGGAAEDDDAPLLGVTPGFPLLVVHYTPIAPGGTPILTSCTRSRYDRFTYELSIPLHDSPPLERPRTRRPARPG